MKINFFEKPGCTNNTKQKKLLESKGHIIIPHSIITTNWTAESLRLFFGNMPVDKWFNMSAPNIKNGQINPMTFSEKAAIEIMLNEPLLIRRPLIEVDGKFACGFDNELVNLLLDNVDVSNLQNCPKMNGNSSCD